VASNFITRPLNKMFGVETPAEQRAKENRELPILQAKGYGGNPLPKNVDVNSTYDPYASSKAYGSVAREAYKEIHESGLDTPRKPIETRPELKLMKQDSLSHVQDMGSMGSQQFPWASTRFHVRYNPFGGKKKRKKNRIYVS